MKERPILFSGPMVRAILDGRKRMTRRIVKPQPDFIAGCGDERDLGGWMKGTPLIANEVEHPIYGSSTPIRCPYGEPSDRLWVRETWGLYDTQPSDGPSKAKVFYRATHNLRYQLWRPSIHMPRWASRITLEVTAERVERVQDIREADIRAEGFGDAYDDWREEVTQYAPPGLSRIETIREFFAGQWDKIYGHGAWDRNDWVWVVEFKVVEKAKGQLCSSNPMQPDSRLPTRRLT